MEEKPAIYDLGLEVYSALLKKITKIRRLMSNEEKAKEMDKYLLLMLQKDQQDRKNTGGFFEEITPVTHGSLQHLSGS